MTDVADNDANRAVYVISVAAELTGVHPQTLRIYERKGLLDPSRTSGGSRRFSDADLTRLRHIQQLTATGLNLEGVRRVLELESRAGTAAGRARRGAGAVPGRGGRHPSAVPPGPGPAAPVARRVQEEVTDPMPIDPERWTNNTKAAFSAATAHAASANNPEMTPAHLLDALLGRTRR